MKEIVVLLAFLIFQYSFSQVNEMTQKVWRANFINPGVEVELPLSNKTTFSTNVGLGYHGSYPSLTETTFSSGFIYVITPFVDIQVKRFYNFDKRINKNKSIENNSGNFISGRLITRGPSITDNIERKSNYDFAIGPTWGIQRSFDNFHFIFDMGPQYYFDIDGNHGFWPLMIQLNIGLNLNRPEK